MMYSAFVLAAIAGAALVSAVVHPDAAAQQQPQQHLQLAGSAPIAEAKVIPGQPPLNQQKPVLPYYYPTYPVYTPDTGYGVQTGYEGYLVPTEQDNTKLSWKSKIFGVLIPLARYALVYGLRIFVHLWKVVVLLVAGGALTAGLCTYTTLCTMTFAGYDFSKFKVRDQVSELARTYVTPEGLNSATMFVKKAIDGYAELSRGSKEAEGSINAEAKQRRRR